MLTYLKNSAAMRLLAPRFSKRRAFAARAWRGGKGCLTAAWAMFGLMRMHGFAGGMRRMRWQWRMEREDQIGIPAVPPPAILPQLLAETYPQGVPVLSVVAPLYAKRDEVPFFLRTLFRQDYPGQVEVVLVDDCCPQQSMEKAQEIFDSLRGQFPSSRLSLKTVSTGDNSGNCRARNLGFAAATGDIVMVLDADCLLSASLLSLHALYMAAGPYDALFGPCNLETGHRRPLDALREYESDPRRVLREWVPQDSLCPAGFVNCITRNFSIRKNRAPLPLFDEEFSYSADPESGFGWEDVEMGRRLYDAGLRLGYAEGTFTVHISHGQGLPQQGKAVRSLRNFVKLLKKHPDMPAIAGRWVHHTHEAIRRLDGYLVPPDTPERRGAEQIIKPRPGGAHTPVTAMPRKRLRILSFHWHTSHQYELFKLPHDFFLVRGLGESFVQNWNIDRRPQPDNVRFVHHTVIKAQDYDLAIVPFDENVLAPYNCNDALGPGWGDAFLWFSEHLSLPMVGICHGTPQFYGQYNASYAGPDLLQTIESERLRLVEAVRDFTVVCNSHQAMQEWGFPRSTVIWHGFDPMEFPLRPRGSTGCLTLGEESMRSRPFYNGLFVCRETTRALPEDCVPRKISTPSPQTGILKGNFYARAKFRNYVDVLRDHSVYFNPTLRSPMPRTRGEAMLCGLVPVSLPNHDADMFIQNGKNGFLGERPEELGESVTFCLKNSDAAWRMGLEARKSACALFSLDRYLSEWQTLLHTTL